MANEEANKKRHRQKTLELKGTIYEEEVELFKQDYVRRHEDIKADFTEACNRAFKTAKQLGALHKEGADFLEALHVSTRESIEEDLGDEEFKMPPQVDVEKWGDYPERRVKTALELGEVETTNKVADKSKETDKPRAVEKISQVAGPQENTREQVAGPQDTNREQVVYKPQQLGKEGPKAPERREKAPEEQVAGKRGRQEDERQKSRSPKRQERGGKASKEEHHEGGGVRRERHEMGMQQKEERRGQETRQEREHVVRQDWGQEGRQKRGQEARQERGQDGRQERGQDGRQERGQEGRHERGQEMRQERWQEARQERGNEVHGFREEKDIPCPRGDKCWIITENKDCSFNHDHLGQVVDRSQRIQEARRQRDREEHEERRARERARAEARAARHPSTRPPPPRKEDLLPVQEIFEATGKEPSMGSKF